jgi:pilus assembly protein CpaE
LKSITVGILAASSDRAASLKALLARSAVATRILYAAEFSRQPVGDEPEIVMIEIEEQEAGLRMVQVLHSAAPNARLFVISGLGDPQLDPQLMIELMRAGVREFLPSPVSQSSLLQAFNRQIAESERATSQAKARAKRGKLYCVTSAKHGSGATTVALNLAGIIAGRSGQRVGLLDLDRPLGDAAAYLNVKSSYTVMDALNAGSKLDSVLLESYMQSSHGFQILSGFSEHSSDTSLSADRLSHLLEVAQATFRHTIADLPTSLDEDQVRTITRSSAAILVVLTPELPAIWRTERLLAYLTKLHAAEKVRIVLNRSTRSDEIGDADIERLLRMPLYCKLPNEYGACIKAINSGTLLDSTGGRHLSRAIGTLAADVADLPGTESRRGLLGLLLKPSAGGSHA